MPVRSLNSPVFRWPNRTQVAEAVAAWAAREAARQVGVLAVGYFGSYAQGNWGVGSDVDLVAIVEASSEPFESRSVSWDTTSLPVPAQLLVYTRREWLDLIAKTDRFARMLSSQTVWVRGEAP